MAKIHKIKSNGNTIYPATIPQAVVDPETQVPLNVTLDSVDGRLSDAEETISAIVGTDYLHYSYGIEINDSIADSAKTRIGNLSLHAQLPIQSRMRKCLLLDNGKVNYYLNANNGNLKEDGTAANLDGTDGMVMVEVPKHYRKFETEGTLFRVYISEMPISGFHIVPKMYISAYEASIDRTNASLPKLASVVNSSAAFRGGNNTATWMVHIGHYSADREQIHL
ncbi:hypothetical protein [Bacteroides reticulotermitis]|uniref:Uncharacterized protein n=1 Tax=Bacteroides reticulotermitis JCM 10512 TaxID=1445607 RepID=W4US46_9BACE|nr:hypothetical protein [Bacteroides reticulotermitis]GAE83344.1 hypothetical protein JCM10512_1610 [Bacteroides reticulotermitis JCM 10512]